MAEPLPRLLVIGDSISRHYWPHLEHTLSAQCRCRHRSFDPANPGTRLKVGNDSGRVLAWIREQPAEDRLSADWLLLNCGLHDIKTELTRCERQVPLTHYQENVGAIVDDVRGRGVRIVWVRTTPIDERLSNELKGWPRPKKYHRYMRDILDYNAAADAVMKARDIPLIDLFGFTQPLLPGGTADGVHFNDEVRRQQADHIARRLREIWHSYRCSS